LQRPNAARRALATKRALALLRMLALLVRKSASVRMPELLQVRRLELPLVRRLELPPALVPGLLPQPQPSPEQQLSLKPQQVLALEMKLSPPSCHQERHRLPPFWLARASAWQAQCRLPRRRRSGRACGASVWRRWYRRGRPCRRRSSQLV
jgi:hypothetical protein